MLMTLSGHSGELINNAREKSSWVIPKMVAVVYGSGSLRELFIKKIKSSSNGVSQKSL